MTAEDDTAIFDDSQQTRSEVCELKGLRENAAHLIQAIEDKSFTTFEIMEAVAYHSDFQ